MSDATVLANAKRQAELQAQGRDLTKEVPPLGSTIDSIIEKYPGLTLADLENRATFNLKDHMRGIKTVAPVPVNTLDLTDMSPQELRGLAQAAEQQATLKEKQ